LKDSHRPYFPLFFPSCQLIFFDENSIRSVLPHPLAKGSEK